MWDGGVLERERVLSRCLSHPLLHVFPNTLLSLIHIPHPFPLFLLTHPPLQPVHEILITVRVEVFNILDPSKGDCPYSIPTHLHSNMSTVHVTLSASVVSVRHTGCLHTLSLSTSNTSFMRTLFSLTCVSFLCTLVHTGEGGCECEIGMC